MPAVFELPITVGPDDIDEQGIVSNVRFVAWMSRAAVAHSDAQGWPARRYHEHGVGWVVRSHRVDYRRPARVGDELIARTWVATMTKTTSLRQYRFVHAATGELLVQGETLWAFIDAARHAPCRIPADVRTAFDIIPDARGFATGTSRTRSSPAPAPRDSGR